MSVQEMIEMTKEVEMMIKEVEEMKSRTNVVISRVTEDLVVSEDYFKMLQGGLV
jgi:hypothetical protein